MPSKRVCATRGSVPGVVLGIGFLLVCVFPLARAMPWHLGSGSNCSTCLRIDEAWDSYGKGHPDIAVAVAEKDVFRDTRSAATWHPGLVRRFELFLGSHAPPFLDPHPRYDSKGGATTARQEFDELFARFKRENAGSGPATLAGALDTPAQPPDTATSTRDTPASSPEMCSFVSGGGSASPRNHDLQMAGLVGGQTYMGTSGVAPGTRVILTRARLAHGGLDLLADLIARRPEVRVVNFSQGPGHLPADDGTRRRASHLLVHYHKLNRLVMELSVAGMLESRARSATRFVVVAAAGNVPAFVETEPYEPQEVLDARIPFQAIHFGKVDVTYVDLRPRYLRDVPRPDLPLVVVGALGPTGMLPSYGRIDQGIDLYAPAGLDWLAHVRAPPSRDATHRLGSAQWQECMCARVARDHANFADRTDYDPPTCWPTERDPAWFQLGVPTLDFHIHAFTHHDEPFTPLRTHCAESPNSICSSLATGTSAAAALVSGVAALMFALDPTLSGEEAAAILKSTARTDNPLRLPVVDPGAALDAVVHRIGARLVSALADSPKLTPLLAAPFYYTWPGEPEPFVFTDAARAARFVAESFTWLGPGNRWRVEGLGDARIVRCGVGLAGSTVGIRRLLDAHDACAESGDEVEILRVELDLSDGRRHLDLRVVWRRAGRLGPQTEWRVAGLSVTEESTT